MTKSIDSLVNLLIAVDATQVNLLFDALAPNDIKIIRTKVLPQIDNTEKRILFKKKLNQSEQARSKGSNDTHIIPHLIDPNPTIDTHLNHIIQQFMLLILLQLSDSESRKLFFERITDDELFIIEQRLTNKPLSIHTQALYDALTSEKTKRTAPSQPLSEMATYRSYWREKRKNTPWETNLWHTILKNIKKSIAEVDQAALHPANTKEASQPWHLIIWVAIKQFFSYLNPFNYIKLNKVLPLNEKIVQDFTVCLNESEENEIKEMGKKAAVKAAKSSKSDTESILNTRDISTIKKSIHSRFGFVLASQMVAGTKGDKHDDLHSVADSFAISTDSNETTKNIRSGISGVVKGKESPLKGSHKFSTGGAPEIITSFEAAVINKVLKSSEDFKQYGLDFSADELNQIKIFGDNFLKSNDLNNIISTLADSCGGYDFTGEDEHLTYKKSEHNFEEKQNKFMHQCELASKAVQNSCAKLDDGNALYLETGLEGHAMKLSIKKIGNTLKISCYDSSGALENTVNSNSFWGLITLWKMNSSSKRKNALSFTIPEEKLYSNEGQTYLADLLELNSYASWAKESLAHDLAHSTRENRSKMGWLQEKLALRRQSFIYQNYIDKFTSIEDKNSPAKFDDLLQLPQNTENCYAKKALSTQLYELGKSTYKKLRMATLIEQREALINDVCTTNKEPSIGEALIHYEYHDMLKNIKPEILSPEELHNASMRLCELKDIPSTAYYQDFFNEMMHVREELVKNNSKESQLAIDRIDIKLSKHAQEYYRYLNQGKRQKEIDALFVTDLCHTDPMKDWDPKIMPFIISDDNKINKEAINKISEFSASQAWKASLQLINHQIKKTSIPERYIKTSSNRLSNMGLRQAKKTVTLNDLANANIVRCTEGLARKEIIKIELNISGKRKEIDLDTFFSLVVDNKEALTNHKVINLLDCLRNSSPETEKSFLTSVYTSQREEFNQQLDIKIKDSLQNLNLCLSNLKEHKVTLSTALKQCENNLSKLSEQINREKENSDLDKKPLHIIVLTSHYDLLTKEKSQLTTFLNQIDVQINHQSQPQEISGSPYFTINNAILIATNIKKNNKGYQSIKEVTNAFVKSDNTLTLLINQSNQIINDIETNNIEEQENIQERRLNDYCNHTVKTYLQSNDEYQILNELSLGKMGTHKERHSGDYKDSSISDTASTYLKGSIFEKIQSLNKKLKNDVEAIIERNVFLNLEQPQRESNYLIDGFGSKNNQYIKINKIAQTLSHQSIPQSIKNEWVKEMFSLWLKHQNPEQLFEVQNFSDSLAIKSINHSFHQFIEKKANIGIESLKSARYVIELNESHLTLFKCMPVQDISLKMYKEKREEAGKKIFFSFKKSMKDYAIETPQKKSHATIINQLKGSDLISRHNKSLMPGKFNAPNVSFLSALDRETCGSNTLTFLKNNPMPTLPIGNLQKDNEQYITQVKNHLNALSQQPGLENKQQRMSQFCFHAASELSQLSNVVPNELSAALAKVIISQYQEEEDGTVDNQFMTLENTQRTQILSSLIQLSLSSLRISTAGTILVNPEFYSMIKQWQRLILPENKTLSEKISMLSAEGTEPLDMDLLNIVDNAIHLSPIGLEGLHEGQKGLQAALTAYGRETVIDPSLRKLADKMYMRNGKSLQANQFFDFYSKKDFLFSSEGINSTQGREFFNRALLDAFQNASQSEKLSLFEYLNELQLSDEITEDATCKLVTPHAVFLETLKVPFYKIASFYS